MKRACLLAVAMMLPVAAQAEALHAVQAGRRLEVDIACARHIALVADPAVSGQAVMDAAADHPEEIAQIVFTGGDTAKVKARGPCWRGPDPGRFEPTLDITMHVPPAFPVGIDAAGSTTYHVAVGGALSVDLSGSGQLEATRVTSLAMDVSGSGFVQVANVTGALTVDLSGSAKMVLGHVDSPVASIKTSGSGHLRIDGGSIGQIAVDGSGSGDVALGGTIGNAAVDLSGSGNITIAKLSGTLTQDASGSGRITVLSH